MFLFILLSFIADLLFIMYENLIKKTNDLYQYEIKNFYYTYIICVIYIFFFYFLSLFFSLYIYK